MCGGESSRNLDTISFHRSRDRLSPPASAAHSTHKPMVEKSSRQLSACQLTEHLPMSNRGSGLRSRLLAALSIRLTRVRLKAQLPCPADADSSVPRLPPPSPLPCLFCSSSSPSARARIHSLRSRTLCRVSPTPLSFSTLVTTQKRSARQGSLNAFARLSPGPARKSPGAFHGWAKSLNPRYCGINKKIRGGGVRG